MLFQFLLMTALSLQPVFADETKGVKEDALACVKMAVAMQRRMQALQSEWIDLGIEKPFQLRIGINTGFCTVGNFGSEDRMDYTLIGGEVNLAARLQSHAELGGILIAHETHSLVKDVVVTEELEPIRAKGFAKPIRTYRVLGMRDEGMEAVSTLHHHQPGISINLDLSQMTAQSKAAAVQAVEELLARLKR